MSFARLPLAGLVVVLSSLAACIGHDREDAMVAGAASAPTPAMTLARGRVDVPGGLLRLSAPRAGRIERWAADAGQSVKAGQLLVMLDNREAQAALALAQAEIAQARAQLGAQSARLPSARERAARALQAAQAGAASGQAADDARDAVREIDQQIVVLRTGVTLVERKLMQAELAANAASIRAPIAAQVVQRFAQAGEHVEAHAPLVQLLPEGPRLVRAELNEALLSRVRPGMRAEVTTTASDGPAQGARVLRIGEVFGPSRSGDAVAGEATDARTVECWLQLDNADLRVGQRVLVRFIN